MDVEEISARLDIGSEFLFLDTFQITKIIDIDNESTLKNSKVFSGEGSYKFLKNKWWKGHFLSEEVVPSTLILESMLQCSAMTIYSHANLPKNEHALIVAIEAEFKQKISPNETIFIKSNIMSEKRGIIAVSAETFLNQKLSGRAQLKYWCPNYNL